MRIANFFSSISLSRSIRWLLVMLLLTLGFNAVASNGNRTMDYAWLLFLKVNEPPVIVAVGDSITFGSYDDRVPSGYPPRLEGRLESGRGYAHTVWNEGNPGETSSGGSSRIYSIIAAHGDADQYLVMYGTNDASPWRIPVITPSIFKENMQKIIDAIKSAGAQPVLARIPYAKEPRTYYNTYIREFNKVVDELVSTNAIKVTPPDFYYWFEVHQDELNSVDGLHPTPKGYDSMAEIWYFILN